VKPSDIISDLTKISSDLTKENDRLRRQLAEANAGWKAAVRDYDFNHARLAAAECENKILRQQIVRWRNGVIERERDAYRLRLEAMREALDAAMANPDQALDILRDHARVLTRNLATQPAPAEPAPKPFRERCKHSFDSADPLLDTGSATCLECGVRIPISTEPSTADGGEGEANG
jgi:hypothetical protein